MVELPAARARPGPLPDEPRLYSAGEQAEWNRLVANLPYSHVLQSWEWGEFKSRYGWAPRRWHWPAPAAAQVLSRTVWRGLRVLYVPRGPVLDWADAAARSQVLDALQALARRERALFVKIDPGVPVAIGNPGATQPQAEGQSLRAELERRGWVYSPSQVQFRNTVTLDLRRTEAELLAAMKQKTRYNVRLAERRGVQVRLGSAADLDRLYRLYAETSVRDGFVIRSPAYYRDAWGRFMAAGLAQPFIAEVEGEPVSALVLFQFAGTAWYMYGMSREQHREKMPNQLLQWRAIAWAKAAGCETYDFWGAPDVFNEDDRLWGVWKFKEGFGGQVVHGLGAWDYAPYPALYRLYTVALPRVLALLRRRGQRQTAAALDS